MRLNDALNAALKRAPQPEELPSKVRASAGSVSPRCSGWLIFRNLAQNKGTTVIATKNEANSETTTASAIAEKRNLLTPASRVTGKNTTAVVRVEASTGRATSFPPFSAATC